MLKIAVIGLGHFGSHLATELTQMDHEVLAIDKDPDKVEAVRDKVAHAVIADAADKKALEDLGIADYDCGIVAIGESFEGSLLACAHLQEMKIKRMVARVVSPVHERILKQMKIEELILPEGDAAEQLAKRFSIPGLLFSFEVSKDYSIVEVEVPKWAIGKTIIELRLRESFGINLVTIIRERHKDQMLTLGKKKTIEVLGVPDKDQLLQKSDILLLFGKEKEINKFLSE
ncbi:MAG: TrkA family potassium uptake protein [Bdellovibrionales bacterium]|nr:TrkA family potassium uptake protein [Bdellovibrionales bacterium]